MSNRAIYFRKGKGNCDTIVTGKLRPQNGAIINGDTVINGDLIVNGEYPCSGATGATGATGPAGADGLPGPAGASSPNSSSFVFNSTGNPPAWIGIGQDGSQFSQVSSVFPISTIRCLRVLLRAGGVTQGTLTATLYKEDPDDLSGEVSTGISVTFDAVQTPNETWLETTDTFEIDRSCTTVALKIEKTGNFQPSLSTGISALVIFDINE